MEMNIVTLENNKEYVIIATVDDNDLRYFVLVNTEVEDDICIRKVITNSSNEEVLVKLDTNEEFNHVMEVYNNINRKGSNE